MKEPIITVAKDEVIEDAIRVEWFGDDGEMYAAVMIGPYAQERANDYVKVIRREWAECNAPDEGAKRDSSSRKAL